MARRGEAKAHLIEQVQRIQNKTLPFKSGTTPLQVIESLVIAANEVIQDSEKRGWVILTHAKNNITMRRTQTFITNLQFGLLDE